MTTATGPYHRGEREAQERAGLRRKAEISGRAIRDTVPPVAAAFLAEQRLLVAGAADERGDVWATVLTGPAGFLRAPDERSLSVAARPAPADPLASALERPARLGMLAIDTATRRRMRMNGTAHPQGGGLLVDLDQVVANCPKYIQKRTPPGPGPGTPSAPLAARPARVRRGDRLDDGQRRLVAGADTFFVATADEHGRADASHRGGNPGFLQVLTPTRLRWPDYTGNAMLLTLGNLLVNPRAGLVVPDYATGATLHLTGTAEITWGAGAAGGPGDAETGRAVEFTVTGVVELPGTVPAGWSPPEFSRFNPPAPAGGPASSR
ncbi:pyridoxamine 5'-phosphate oxidase family protein [Streptomyces verrucosisporus]|uniref:pyridoxamine 5'-phosphate oxidase family protein n=1 Tax=Streptomyces verrucosisporus TaxID=1695161 RepID=UPI0019D1C088|nr:pyridoxamine 5'-phosphate oxidase family protein [Streptomyces verrucosisporus]MBN3928183.1 pyridoxamine 5'-phosphate oxidase family protein [Streptomyces verrucosisporus]